MGLLSGCIAENCPLNNHCDNPSNTDINEMQAVTIRIVNSTDATTRGVASTLPDGHPVYLNTGRILLLNATGNILRYHRIETTGGNYAMEGGYRFVQGGNGSIINRSWLDNGVIIPTVPSAVTRIVIVGNHTSPGAGAPLPPHTGTSALPTSGSITQVLGAVRTHDIVSQWHERNVGMIGDEALFDTGNTVNFSGRTYRVFDTQDQEPMHLNPNVARFEISSIVGAGDITSFSVQGIFIDGFHRTAQLHGAGISARLAYGTAATDFTNTATRFSTDTRGAVHNWFAPALTGGIGNPVTAATYNTTFSAATHKFGYQVFADGYYSYPLVGSLPAATISPPRIVVRFNSITLANGTVINEPRFLTISRFTPIDNFTNVADVDITNGYLARIRPSRVYRIEAIEFAYSDLSPRPNDNPINVNIRVDIGTWRGQTLRPNQELSTPHPQSVETCDPHNFYLPPAMGGTWDFWYRWQRQEIDANGVAIDNTQEYLTPAPTRTPYLLAAEPGFRYRRRVTDGTYTVYSDWAYVVCVASASMSQVPPLPQTVCPNCIVEMALPTDDATGVAIPEIELEFQWQSSTNPSNPNSWVDAGGTGQHLVIPGITVNTYFRRRAEWITEGTVDYSGHALMTLFQYSRPAPPLYIVLGGTAWAPRNLYFSHPIGSTDFTPRQADIGMYFQWGQPYGWPATGAPTQRWNPRVDASQPATWNPSGIPGTQATILTRPFLSIWAQGDDPCRFADDGNWRLPTRDEHQVLITGAGITRTWLSAREAAERGFGCQAGGAYGVAGNPYQLFFPAAGTRARVGGGLTGININVSYWNSTPFGTTSDEWSHIHNLTNANNHTQVNLPRGAGTNIRCVRMRPQEIRQPYLASAWVVYGSSHTFELGPATGGTGAFTYQWQRSRVYRADWHDIPGATGLNYTPPAFNSSIFTTPSPLPVGTGRYGVYRFFRRCATSGGSTHCVEAQVIVFAASNLGANDVWASAPHNTGMFYQWNRLAAWNATTPAAPSGWPNNYVTADAQWRVANPHVPPRDRDQNPCPNGWRVPHYGELVFLNRSASTWGQQGGVWGRIFTSGTNELFLPGVGERAPDGTLRGTAAYVWSSNTVNYGSGNRVRYMRAGSDGVSFRSAIGSDRGAGRTVRCVMH